MHVGVEEVVLKHLCKKNFNAGFRQFLQVDSVLVERIGISDRDTVDAL